MKDYTHSLRPIGNSEEERHGLVLFQKWLISLQGQQLVQKGLEPGLFKIDRQVANRFLIGLSAKNNYIAMPRLEAEWAKMIGWEYVAIYKEDPTIHLVMSNMEINNHLIGNFGISLSIPDRSTAALLRIKKSIDFKEIIDGKLRGLPNIPSFARLPILVIEENFSVFGRKLSGGKKPSSKNKSN